MKFRQKITLYLLLTFVFGSVAFAQLVHIPDPNFRAAILGALDIADRPDVQLDASVLRRLTNLNAGVRGISDLTGLEHATSLTTLLLHNNEISDLRVLANLVNLTLLRLHGNQINDLSPSPTSPNSRHCYWTATTSPTSVLSPTLMYCLVFGGNRTSDSVVAIGYA